ncbi:MULTISPECIES: TerL [unclassified Caballeronia]|uniref:TerL n=1 Tax=unclassified Caballeronia TaxID=2646786 RepID=UPI001F41793B|nr:MULTISPECIES: TerL [unclassified Caballeronia]MCE4544604.1 TerL [Caballeronia sp. PC1]MCE4571756.1 TerL [Caballeronia sp. CLC5]
MSDDIEFRYEPQGETLERYILSTVRRTVIRGPLGSGKTNASCWKGFRIMCAQEPDAEGVRRTRGIAVRNTYSDLLSTTIKDWLDMFGDLGRYVGGGREPPTHYLSFDLEDGTSVEAEVVFIAFDRPEDVKKARGLQATWVWLNEVKELAKPVVDMLDLRVGRYPKDVRPTWYGMFGDTNSPDTDHWLYLLAEETKPDGWLFLTQPGGVIRDGEKYAPNPHAENLINLPPGYYENGMQGKKADWVKVNLANEYGFVIDGRPIHPDYVDSLHCRPFEILRVSPIFIGMDFGLTPAVTFGQRKPMGGWRIHSELVATSMGAKKFGQEIKRHVAVHYPDMELMAISGDPAGDQRSQADDEDTPFKILRAAGLAAKPAPTNDTALRYGAVDEALSRIIDGEPGLIVHPQCTTLRKALAGGYCFRRLAVSGERFADKADKNMYSHVAEALQYMLVGAGEHKHLVAPVRVKPRAARAIMD